MAAPSREADDVRRTGLFGVLGVRLGVFFLHLLGPNNRVGFCPASRFSSRFAYVAEAVLMLRVLGLPEGKPTAMRYKKTPLCPRDPAANAKYVPICPYLHGVVTPEFTEA